MKKNSNQNSWLFLGSLEVVWRTKKKAEVKTEPFCLREWLRCLCLYKLICNNLAIEKQKRLVVVWV